MTDAQWKYFKRIGDGEASVGVLRSLVHYKTTHKNKQSRS